MDMWKRLCGALVCLCLTVSLLPAVRTSPLAQRERLTFPELASEAFAMNLEAPEGASVVSLLVARACREAGFMPKVSVNLQQFLPTPEVA